MYADYAIICAGSGARRSHSLRGRAMAMNRKERQEFAERLIARFQQLQKDEGWTQQTLADEAGLSLRAVNALLRRESVPHEDTCRKFA